MIKKLGSKCKLVLMLTFILILMGCRQFEYQGDSPELFSVAISSILGQFGYELDIPIGSTAPAINILEEDNYGRILFSYSEGNYIYIGDDTDIRLVHRVIIQKVDGDYAYFYPHYNFISASIIYPPPEVTTVERTRPLKAANSWNRPMSDSSEFERVRIVRQKEDGPVRINRLIEVYREIFPDSNIGRTQINFRMNFLRTDRYGRSVYLASRVGTHIAVLFQPDHSFDIETGMLEIEDLHNYQTKLRLFMEANGWNEHWDD